MRAALVRALSIDVFARSHQRGELADRALSRMLRENRQLHSVERRRIAEAAFTMVRLVRRFDYQLGRLVPDYEDRSTPERDRLRYACALQWLGESVPAIESAAELRARDAAAISKLATFTEWPTDPVTRLGVEKSVPDWFARRLFEEYGDEASSLADALNERAPLVLRTNVLKSTRERVLAELLEKELGARPGVLSPWAVVLDERPNVVALGMYRKGFVEVQDEGSQLIALACEARPQTTVVDACAGAGGKTLALGATMENRGRLVSIDVTEQRLEDLRPRARRAGLSVVETRVVPEGATGDKRLANLVGKADVVLVDAPCSGTGAWRRNPDGRWRMGEKETLGFPMIQQRVLMRYAQLVKPGGRLVYATCSILRSENDDVVELFRMARRDFVEVPVEMLPAAVRTEKGRMQTLPHRHGTDGFFTAVFERRR